MHHRKPNLGTLNDKSKKKKKEKDTSGKINDSIHNPGVRETVLSGNLEKIKEQWVDSCEYVEIRKIFMGKEK